MKTPSFLSLAESTIEKVFSSEVLKTLPFALYINFNTMQDAWPLSHIATARGCEDKG
jgi:hypothetical protein